MNVWLRLAPIAETFPVSLLLPHTRLTSLLAAFQLLVNLHLETWKRDRVKGNALALAPLPPKSRAFLVILSLHHGRKSKTKQKPVISSVTVFPIEQKNFFPLYFFLLHTMLFIVSLEFKGQLVLHGSLCFCLGERTKKDPDEYTVVPLLRSATTVGGVSYLACLALLS